MVHFYVNVGVLSYFKPFLFQPLFRSVFLVFFLFLIGNTQEVFSFQNAYPFPTAGNYATHIKPSGVDLNLITRNYYDLWKAQYLRTDCGNYYVSVRNATVDLNSVSEAHGYGMMLAVYFAGHDPQAQIIFNGLYNYFRDNPSRTNNYLMDWLQMTCDDPASTDDNSALDGDIDIAYALLFAHAQWGIAGTIDYITEARRVINAIMQYDVNRETWTIKLGDWSTSSNANYYYSTRTSDFIPSHFRAFAAATGDDNWNNIINTCYNLIDQMQTDFALVTGLMPDFIVNTNTSPQACFCWVFRRQEEKRVITTALPFLNVKTDARSSGMGTLGVASSPDIYAQFWNTAKFTFAEKDNAIAVSYLPFARKVSNNLLMAGVSYFKQRNECSAWGLGLKYFQLGELELNQFDGGQVVSLGVEQPNEFAIDFSYNLKLNTFFSMGVTSRFFRSDIGYRTGNSKAALSSLAFDISAYYEKDIADNIRFRSGAVLSNLGPKVKYDSDQTPNFIPTQLRFGSGATFSFENNQSLMVLLEFNKLLVPTLPDPNNEINFLKGIFRSFSDAPDG